MILLPGSRGPEFDSPLSPFFSFFSSSLFLFFSFLFLFFFLSSSSFLLSSSSSLPLPLFLFLSSSLLLFPFFFLFFLPASALFLTCFRFLPYLLPLSSLPASAPNGSTPVLTRGTRTCYRPRWYSSFSSYLLPLLIVRLLFACV